MRFSSENPENVLAYLKKTIKNTSLKQCAVIFQMWQRPKRNGDFFSCDQFVSFKKISESATLRCRQIEQKKSSVNAVVRWDIE